MMDQRDLDHTIDAATQEMMAREPSRALGYNVMARVSGGKLTRRRSWVLATSSASAICVVIAFFVLSRSQPPLIPTATQQASRTEQPQTPTARITPEPAVRINSLPASARAPETRRIASVAVSAPFVAAALTAQSVPLIEPLQPEPIRLSVIDLQPLETRATVIERIEIAGLTIEPLTASND